MGTDVICTCDRCEKLIDVSDGFKPARLNVWPPTPADFGHQQDEHWLCTDCWEQFCRFFPKAKEAERFTKPAPAPEPVVITPAVVSEDDKALLLALAKRLGLKIEET